MYQKNQNQTQVPNLNNASVQHPSTSQPGGMVPEARQALEDMKYEIAGELGINLKQGYNGDLPSRQAGSIGGYMVKRLIEQAERLPTWANPKSLGTEGVKGGDRKAPLSPPQRRNSPA